MKFYYTSINKHLLMEKLSNITTRPLTSQPADEDKLLSPKLDALFDKHYDSHFDKLYKADNDSYWLKLKSQRRLLSENFRKAESILWTSAQFSWDVDRQQFPSLPHNVRTTIRRIIAFFITGDGLVNMNIVDNYLTVSTLNEMKKFYQLQMYIESVHAETYQDALVAFVPDEAEQEQFLNAFRTIPQIKAIADFCQQYNRDDAVLSFRERNFIYAIVEGAIFCPLFAIISKIKEVGGILPTFCLSNDKIQEDESVHRRNSAIVNSCLEHPITQEEAEQILRPAMDILCKYVDFILEDPIYNISAEDMKRHSLVIADGLLVEFGLNKIYNEKSPYESLVRAQRQQQETSFFEAKNPGYTSSASNHVTTKRALFGKKP